MIPTEKTINKQLTSETSLSASARLTGEALDSGWDGPARFLRLPYITGIVPMHHNNPGREGSLDLQERTVKMTTTHGAEANPLLR